MLLGLAADYRLCQGDQLSIDKGLWTVAAELSLEDSPPFSSFATHTLPTETEAPHTKLVDGRWMDLILHRLSSYDLLTEKKKKLGAKKFLPPPGAEEEAKGGGKSRNQQLVIGIVIDDLIAIEKIPRCLPAPESLASQVADEMVALYEKVGLQPNASKRLRSASVADFWGAHLDGEAGLIGAPIQRVLPIAFLSSQVARLGFATRKLLEVLAGAWTSILQFRKRSMCLLESIFSVITAHSYQEIFAIPGDLVAELWLLTTLAPLCITDLRAQTSSTLSLVDASSDWKAEVVCDLPKSFMKELGRHALSKAAWRRMLTPYKALMRSRGVLAAEDEVPDGEEPLRAHPLWSAIVTSQQFSSVGRTKVKKGKHINISELEALLECEKRRGVVQSNSRLLIGSDSQVVLGSVLKGRSSSRSLNVRLKQHLPWLFGFNICSSFQYVCTGENVADDPTRDRPVGSPSASPPAWLGRAMQGEFEDMDAFLLQYELDDQSVARLPHFATPSVPPVDPLSNRNVTRCGRRNLRSLLDHQSLVAGPSHGASACSFLRWRWIFWDNCRDLNLFCLEGNPGKM